MLADKKKEGRQVGRILKFRGNKNPTFNHISEIIIPCAANTPHYLHRNNGMFTHRETRTVELHQLKMEQ